MFQKVSIASLLIAGILLGATAARAESVNVTFANANNATIKVTAIDRNNGDKVIIRDETLKHNEQVTGKMELKGTNGNVKWTAKGDDAGYTCSEKSYEGTQLSRGHSFNISIDCKKK